MLTRRAFASGLVAFAIAPKLFASRAPVAIQPFYSAKDQPLGYIPVSDQSIDVVAKAMREIYGLDSDVLDTRRLPDDAFIAVKGKRYRAPKLIDHLERTGTPPRFLIGLTDVDISTEKYRQGRLDPDWGTIAIARLGGYASMISTRRIRGPRLNDRLKKVVVHEIAHNLGLSHCGTGECNLTDIHGSVARLDRVEYGRFCMDHRKKIAADLRVRESYTST